jgi:hypothetical protein
MKQDMSEVLGWLQRVLDFPLLRLQGGQPTVLDLFKLCVLLVLVLVLERYVRRVVAAWLLRRSLERELAPPAVATVYGLDTLLTKGDGGRDAVFGFPERVLAGLGLVSFRQVPVPEWTRCLLRSSPRRLPRATPAGPAESRLNR